MRYRALRLVILLAGDAAVVILAQAAAFTLRFHSGLFSAVVPSVPRYILLGGTSVVVFVVAQALMGGYRLKRRPEAWRHAVLLLRVTACHAGAVAFALLVFRLGTYRSEEPFLYSRAVVASGWLATFALGVAWRTAFASGSLALARRGVGVRRALVVGDEGGVKALAEALAGNPWIGDVVTLRVEAPTEIVPVEQVREALGARRIDVVWLAWPHDRPQWVLDLVQSCEVQGVRWAVPTSSFDLLLQALAPIGDAGEALGEEVAARLLHTLEHDVDPLQKPRVTFVGSRGIPATYGGVERAVEELGVRLAALGFGVSVYCRPHYTSVRGTYRGVELRRLPCIRTKHLEAITHTLLSTAHLLFQEDDVVHYQALGPSLLAGVPRLAGRKTVATVQGLDWQRKKWGLIARAVLRVGEWAAAHVPHRTVVVSRDLQRHFETTHATRVVYIPNGVNEAVHRPPDLITAWGLERDSYVLAVGRLVPEKRFDLLVDAFASVHTDKRLVIAGGESHSSPYATGLRERAGDPRVLFTGFTYGAALEELFSNAFLFVSASEVEGLPLTLLEAMSHGLGVLVSDIPPHLEALGGMGATFRTGDVHDLRTKLQALLDAPEEVRAMGEALRVRALSAYAWGPVAESHASLYLTLVSP